MTRTSLPRLFVSLVLAPSCGARTPLGDGEQVESANQLAFRIGDPAVGLDCFPPIRPNEDRLKVQARLIARVDSARAFTITRGEILADDGAVRYAFAVDPGGWTWTSSGLERGVLKSRGSVSPKGTCALSGDDRVRLRLFLRGSDGVEVTTTSEELTPFITS